MDNIEAKLAREQGSEGTGMSLCCLDADEDFAVSKSKHIGRTRLMHKFPM